MRRLAHHVAVAMALLAVLAAAAVALVHFGGWPPPHDLPDPSRVSGPAAVHPAIITAGFALGWLAWAAALATVLTRTVTGIGGALAALPRLRLPGPLQTL